MPARISRFSNSGWVEVSDLEGLDNRVDVLEAVSILPAFIGPRPIAPTDAWFSRSDSGGIGATGFAVRPGLAFVQLDKPATFGIYQSTTTGASTSNAIATFDSVRSNINSSSQGQHPVHGPTYTGWWRNGADGGGDYTLLADATNTFLNVPTGGTLRFRSNNSDIGSATASGFNLPSLTATTITTTNFTTSTFSTGTLTVTGTFNCGGVNAGSGSITAGAISASGNISGANLGTTGAVTTAYLGCSGNIDCNAQITAMSLVQGRRVFAGDWQSSQIIAHPSGGTQALVSLVIDNYAASMWRIANTRGEQLDAVNFNSNVFVPIASLRHDTMSTATMKKGIRALRPERERIVVRLDPAADEIEDVPDVMALRPVVFRHKEPAHHPDGSEFDGIIGAESKRERIGLIAEETQYVVPSAVTHDSEGNAMGIDYSQITVALLDHVQRLTDEIATLRYRVAELEREEDK